jgi:hypothetical protein
MTKKHFQLFAENIAKIENESEREKAISFIIPILKQSNFRFNENLFREFINRRLKGIDLKGLRVNPKYLYN